MRSLPLVYIIVLNYNRKDDTLDCLRSLYGMDYPNFRVVMVDNASKDGTAAAVREAFPRAVVIETGANLMYAGGNNAGLQLALKDGADYAMLLNNDTVVAPDMLSILVDAVEGYHLAGIAGPMMYYYAKKDGRDQIWYAGGIVDLLRGLTAHRGIREVDAGQYSKVEETGYVTGCGMLIYRACLEKVGMLDTAYFLYAEDSDYSMRAMRAGFKLLFVPKAKLWHKVSASSGGEFSWFKLKNKAKSNIRFLFRYASPLQLVVMPFFILGRVLAFGIRRIFHR